MWAMVSLLASGIDGPRNLRLSREARISDACSSSGWNLPDPRSEEQLSLHTHLTTIALPALSSKEDSFWWMTNGSTSSVFSSSITWEEIRPREDRKPWAKTVWFKGCVPKYAFNMWIAQLNRLPTRVRLATWGMNISTLCCLCPDREETREHLLLACGYSHQIWSMVFARLSPSQHMLRTWAELLSWTRSHSVAAPSILKKVVVQATIYHIWRQRNNILHNQQQIPPPTIFRGIDRDIKNIISGRRRRRRFSSLMLLWIR
ncbi:uncharacterized protein LOC112082120 [Eutrema salsugineum]|uniref:uncharacterized protein LOC112082120 n=1 Tax=Eutrema salsugineum TaxID=72664 RepID=UPI000CED3085|nr:uncharacterized protein LOC112082120 [Eutrema salsugineum]